ncbi:MAG TPA: DUF748 domain-containing protein, partial [Parafilimonas sp.]|nr:DUF748 domain-containing protein [Parafilimonas sp.]
MKRKRTGKFLIYVFIGALMLVTVLLVGNALVKSVIQKKISATLQQFAPYVISDFSAIHVNLIGASVRIDSLVLRYQPVLDKNHSHAAYFQSVSITGICLLKFISSKDLSAANVRLDNALIKLDRFLLDRNDTIPSNAFNNVHLPFNTMFLNSVELRHVSVLEVKNEKQDTLLNGELSIYNVRIYDIDSSFSKDSIHFSNVLCELNDIKYQLADYELLQIKKISINSSDSVLEINSLRIIPQLGKIAFGQKLGHQADRIEGTVAHIKVSGLNMPQLLQKKFFAQELVISNAQMDVFRDRRLPREMKVQPTSLDYLKKIPIEVHIHHFKLNDALVESEEFPKEGAQTGSIKMDHINIDISPLVNHPKKNDPAFLTTIVRGSIMNAGSLHATIRLDLSSGAQYIKGTIADLKLPALNPCAENLGKFHIQSGVLNKLDFQFTATNEKASGQIVGVYHDLVIDRLKL